MPSKPCINILFIFALPFFAAAQKADFRFYTMADGLPQNQVYSIAQDTQGFIWVNAGLHLTRFDGARFLSHSNSKHPIFQKNRGNFQQMQVDGELLVYCNGVQITSTNTLTGEETAIPVADRLPAGYDANHGHCIKLGNGKLVAAYPAQEAGKVAVLWLEKGRIDRMVEVSGVAAGRDNFYTMFCGDGLGNLYFVSFGHDAILKFSPKGEKLQTMPIVKDLTRGIARLLPGLRNSVFLTFGSAIQRLEQGADAFQPHPASRLIQIGQNSIYDLVETQEGNLWVACSGKHLLFYDAKQDRVLDYGKELEPIIQNQTTIYKLTLDKSGAIWATTSVGALRVISKTALFDTYFTEQNTVCGGYCSFRGFAENGEGSVFASFYNNIFQISPATSGQSIYSPLLPFDNGPFDLLYHKGNLLLNKGNVFDLKTKQLTNPYRQTVSTLDYGAFASDGKARLWWAFGNKVYELDGPKGVLAWKEIASIPIQGVIEDLVFDPHSGRLWFGGGAMLWSLDPDTRQPKRYGENEPGMLVNLMCIQQDGKGGLWLGTERGLVSFDTQTGKWRRYAQSDGLPNNIVVGILPEGDSCLWLSTFNGLSRFSIGGGRFLNFFKQDGLADNEFNRASFFKASDGRMYFGGVKGVTAFYPNKIMAQYARLQGGGQLLLRSVSMTEEGSDSIHAHIFHDPRRLLDVFYQNKSVSIEFGVLGASKDGQTLFSYLLDGQDKAWSTPSASNSVTFTSLPSGKYSFRVKALDARGNWLPGQVALSLTVHPPWWASWWAYLLYLFALAGIAYGVFLFLKKRWELQTQLHLEQQEAERLKELDSFKSRLFTNITHEFRTPLTVILGMTEELAVGSWQSAVSDQEKQRVERGLGLVSRNGQNLLRLINQLLDLSKLESNTMKLNPQHGDIVPYLRYLTESFHTFANTRNLSLRFFTTLEKLEMDFDPEQVQQVMSNLLSNALKFTLSGGDIRVDLRADFRNLEDFGNLSITVSDTGIGIPEVELPHIFNRFYQVDGSATRPGEGTGIGLAHTLELVKLMGGEIEVESEVGKGTTFTVRLPIKNDELLMMNDESRPAYKPFINMANVGTDMMAADSTFNIHHSTLPNLLIIEDNPDVVTYLKTILDANYETTVAYNGRIGIEMALEQIPDLIISDVMMPEKDGYQVLETLKNDERTSHIPIVLLTAKADAASKLAGLRRGADAYLPKPFDKAELLATLEMMMDNRRRMVAYFSQKQEDGGQTVGGAAGQVEASALPEAQVKTAIEMEAAFMQKIRQIVADNYADEDFALPALCEAIGMSRSQLFRKMRALTDVSPSDFIRNYRMQEAKILLKTTPLSVKEVAYKVGFKDIPHFSRTYQETFGISPSTANK